MLRELRPDLPSPTPRVFNDLKAEMTKNNIFHIFKTSITQTECLQQQEDDLQIMPLWVNASDVRLLLQLNK